MHEIITLQLGQKSNYLATHFWNTQESYFTYSPNEESIVDHDVHFRPGIGADGSETFTPRTLIYDLKGGFGSLRKINALYEIDEPALREGLWNGPAVVQPQEVIQQNAYQRSLEEGVPPPTLTSQSIRYWSDFNRVFFHPKSIVQLNEYELNSSLTPFDNWTAGEELFSSLDKEHDLLDRDLRYFAEEADQMQGIQLMSGIDDAWGGFAARYVDRIRDEYGKTSIVFWGLEDSIKMIPQERRFAKLSNTSRTISEIAPQTSVFVPLTIPATALPPYMALNTHSDWHVSALLATALESMTLPTRLKTSHRDRETFSLLANALNINGNQTIAKLRMSINQKAEMNGQGEISVVDQSTDSRMSETTDIEDEYESRKDNSRPVDMEFFSADSGLPSVGVRRVKKPHVFGSSEVFRQDGTDDQFFDESGTDEGYKRAKRRAAGLTITQRKKLNLSFPLLDSFPEIFSGISQPLTNSVAVNVSLDTDTAVALRLISLQHVVNRAVSVDERESLINSLGDIAEAYEEGYDSGSDDDDD